MIRFTKIPYSIRLILTKKCNLKCLFCLADASSKVQQNELNTDEWLNFFNRLKELCVFNLSISGGEIFLRDDWFVLLKRLRENRKHRITVLTNGTLISRDAANQLCDINVKNISISVDGLEEKHDHIRGEGAFKRTVKGIENLLSIGIKPRISFTPIRSNYRDLGPLIDFMTSFEISVFRVNSLSPEGRCINIYEYIALKFPQQIKEILDVVKEKRKEYPQLNLICNLGFYYYLPKSLKLFLENPLNKNKIKHLKDGCGAASTSCAITQTGDLIPCEGLSNFIGGNIREKDILEIWNYSENFKRIRNLSNIAINQVPYCKDCKYNSLCDGGCRASSFLIYKNLISPDLFCPYHKKIDLRGTLNE